MVPTGTIPTVSAILGDSSIVELVFDPAANVTRLAVFQDGVARIAPEVLADSGRTLRPLPASHNLIRHRALQLPSEPADYGSPEELLDSIGRYVARYVDLPERFLSIAAAYVLLTWVYDAFNELPYLRFRGDYGSGKTRALLVIGSLAYKGFFASGASTVSPIFHTLDTFRGTLIFDEADFRFTDEKAELVKILNNGNAKGFPVFRTMISAKKEFDPRAFLVFGPKIVAMRGFYEDRALESRFITEDMSGRELRVDIPINLPESYRAEALQLRNQLLMYRFRERHRAAVDPMLVDPSLEPRISQVLLPLLSVAPNAGVRQAIREYGRSLQAGVVSDRATSTEGQLLSVIAEIVRTEERISISLSDIVAAFRERYGPEYERPITNRYIGGILRHRLGLALYKSNGVFVLPLTQRERIASLIKHYGAGDSPGKSRGEDAFQGRGDVGSNTKGIR